MVKHFPFFFSWVKKKVFERSNNKINSIHTGKKLKIWFLFGKLIIIKSPSLLLSIINHFYFILFIYIFRNKPKYYIYIYIFLRKPPPSPLIFSKKIVYIINNK